MSLKIYYMTFGCKVNQYETDHIMSIFSADGHIKTDTPEDAEVCIINSCTVTSQADTKLRHFIKRVRRESPECLIVLCGCYPQAFPDKAGALSECDLICGSKNKSSIPELVYKTIADKNITNRVNISPYGSRSSFEPMTNTSSPEKTRAYIKIQDGCDMYCTYCIIPFARGHICSKPLEDICHEAQQLAYSGHKELILTGINLCCYGRDLGGGTRLIDAIKAVNRSAPGVRIRLSSIEPEMISDSDIAEMASIPELCPHFHLSLQSGCDKVLKAMNRHYDTSEYYELVKKLRNAFKNCAITTDIMVGFPDESEDDHKQSMKFAEKVGFASAHIFPYSPRSGTKAASYSGQIDKKIKSRRAADMNRVCKELSLKYNMGFVGKTVEVLFERESCEEYHQGHSREYILVKTARRGDSTLRRQIKRVRITEAYDDCCIGIIEEEEV